MTTLPVVFAITGASGAPYAVRLLDVLARAQVPVELFVAVWVRLRTTHSSGVSRPVGSLIRHSCIPNAAWVSECRLVASVDLPAVIYFIRITGDTFSNEKKLIKQ